MDAAATAFLKRRLHHRRMRAAAVHGLRVVSAGEGGGWLMDFDTSAEIFARAAPWMEAHCADLVAMLPPGDPPQVPHLSIVIMVVGSRGDVQPFIPIGQRLATEHRVRVATHEEFRPMVEGAGLEFYPLAGDPHELMEYMVKTGGRIVPTQLDQIIEDVPKKRAMIADILASTWRACTQPDPSPPDPGRPGAPPFRADAIIANPPSYGHFHCAEALHLPLHLIFTMPWSATSAFPHPLARIPPGDHRPVRNFLSYAVADLLAWGGIGDLVNEFREKTLGLSAIGLAEGASLLGDNELPVTYLWPSGLVPRPADWGPHIELANFVFYDQAEEYRPPQDLLDFLAAGERPIYVGFGSCVVEDPAAISATIFAALEQAGVRGIVSEGWAHLGDGAPPPNVYLIGDCPHDWLFARCCAVCHHGGAGTTAAGLRAGLPTVVVPFFGDQFFWGQVVRTAGAGPEPIPVDRLDAAALAAAFTACANPEMRAHANELGAKLRETDGAELAVQSFYRHLPVEAMRCAVDADRLATLFCELCGQRACAHCADTHHSGHTLFPYRYIDWSARPPHSVTDELRELVVEAASALRAAFEDLVPSAAPRREGVIVSDSEVEAENGPTRPSRKPAPPPGGD